MSYPKDLLILIELLRKLPGVGKRTAERYAFKLLEWKNEEISMLGKAIETLPSSLATCEACGCLKESSKLCFFCPPYRNGNILCIVASAKDVYAIEGSASYKGFYQVLGTLISPLDGKLPEHLPLQKMLERITNLHIQEVVIALDSTLEGDTTSLYLNEHFKKLPLKISRLAFGLPVGSSLEYVDEGTLSLAFVGRRPL